MASSLISQYDLLGNLITSFNTSVEASNAVGLQPKAIATIIRNDSRFCADYFWLKV